MSDLFEHRETYDSHQLSYWKDGVACNRADANTVFISTGSWYLSFKIPEETANVQRLTNMLKSAFAYGKNNKAMEIRQALGCYP